MNRHRHQVGLALTALATCVTLLAPAAARADYRIQPVVRPGDRSGDILIPANGVSWSVGGLNNKDQLLLFMRSALTGSMLLQYSPGKLTPIAVGGGAAPIGKWPRDFELARPMSMNLGGDAAFTMYGDDDSSTPLGTFHWDSVSQRVTPVVLKGMPAPHNLTFLAPGGPSPVINAYGEIAFVAQVKNAAGQSRSAVFFRDQDNRIRPVALPDDELPGGGKIASAGYPSLNDGGVVAFLARREGDDAFSAYTWERGTINPVARVGQKIGATIRVANGTSNGSGGDAVMAVTGVHISNFNRKVLVGVRVSEGSLPGLYQSDGQQLTPIIVPGQHLPGGDVKSLYTTNGLPAVSAGNSRGEYAFIALLQDGRTAAYLLRPNGQPVLLLRSGQRTSLGTVANIIASRGIALNSKGEVAMTIRMAISSDGNTLQGPDVVVLLTPYDS